MLTNNKKNFVRSIAMLLAMLMVMAVCLTGCGSKNALAKAEEAKTTADNVMAALENYIQKDDTAAVEALVKAALTDSVATADELDALAAKLEKYVSVDDVAALIKDEVAKATLDSAMSKDEVLELLKSYYTKEEMDAKLAGYFGDYEPAQVLAILADAMSLKDWNATSDVVLATIESMQTLSASVKNATYTTANMALLNEKLAPLGIVAFEDLDKDGKLTQTDLTLFRADDANLAAFEKMLEYTILRVATMKEMEDLKAAVDAAVAVPTFESEFAALQAQLFALGATVTIGDYDANDKFVADTWATDTYYHGKLFAEDSKKEAQILTLADKAGFHAFAKDHDALLGKYLADQADATGKNGWIAGTAYKMYEVATAGALSVKVVALGDAAPAGTTERGFLGYTTLTDETYLTKLYVDGKLPYNEVLTSPLYAAEFATWMNEVVLAADTDYKLTGMYKTVYTDIYNNTQAVANAADAWKEAYAAAYTQLNYVQSLADKVNDLFQGGVTSTNNPFTGNGVDLFAYSFLFDTIYSKTSAMMTKEYATITDAEFLNALTAAMCEKDGVNNNYAVYLDQLAPYVADFLTANGKSYNGFLKADLYKSMIEKSYDLLWPKYKALAQEWASTMLNDYISIVYAALNDTTVKGQNIPTNSLTVPAKATLAGYMAAGIDGITANDLTDDFAEKFFNGGEFTTGMYKKLGKNFKAHNLAMYYANNGQAYISKWAEGAEYLGATKKNAAGADVVALEQGGHSEAAFANPVTTIAANAELITLRLTGSKLYIDMQIAGANKDEFKASGVPVQDAFDAILKNAVASFDEIYNRFLVDQYMSDDLSDYQKMTLNNTVAIVDELVAFYDLPDNTPIDTAAYEAALEQYLTGVSDDVFSVNTEYTVVSKKIARFNPGKTNVEKSVANFVLIDNIAGITVNHFDTSSSEGVAMVGTEAMAAIDLFRTEAIAEMENILIKANFMGYLDTARGSWSELWLNYYNKVNANDYETQSKLTTLVSKVQDTIAVIEFYATLDGYKLDEYKTIYTTKLLPLIAGKYNKSHIALLSGKDIETILADQFNTADDSILNKQWKKELSKVKTSWTDAMLASAYNFTSFVPGYEKVTPYATRDAYLFVGTAAVELDQLLNGRTAFFTAPNNAIVNLY